MGFLESLFEELTEPILGLGARRKRKEKLYEQIALEEFKLRMLVNPPRTLNLRGGGFTAVPASVAVPILGQKLYDELMRTETQFENVKLAGPKGSPEGNFFNIAFQEMAEILGYTSGFEGPIRIVPEPIDMHVADDPDKVEAKLNELREKYRRLVRTVEAQQHINEINEIVEANRSFRDADEKVFEAADGGFDRLNIAELKRRLTEYAMGRGNMAEHQAAIDQLESELYEYQYNNEQRRIQNYQEWKEKFMQRQKTYEPGREQFDSTQAVSKIVRIKRGRPKKGERFVSGATIKYIIARLIMQKNSLVRLGAGGRNIFNTAMTDNPELWIEILVHVHQILRSRGFTDEQIEDMLINAKNNADRDKIVADILNSTDAEALRDLNDMILRKVLQKGKLTDAQKKILNDNVIGKITPEKAEEGEGIFGNETVFNTLNSRIYERLSALGMDPVTAEDATLNLMTIFREYQLQDMAEAGGVRAGVDLTIGRIADALEELDRKYKSAVAVPSLKSKAREIVEFFFGALELWRKTQEEVQDDLRTPKGIMDSLNKLRADIETAINSLKGLNPNAGSGGAGRPPDSLIPPGFLPPTPGPAIDAGGGRPRPPAPPAPPADDVPVVEETDEEVIREIERMLGIPPGQSILPLEADIAENAVVADGRNPGEVADEYIAGLMRRGDLPDDNLQADLNLPVGRRRVPLRVLFRIAIRVMGYAAGLKFIWDILKNIIDIFLPPPEGDRIPDDPYGPTPGPRPGPDPGPDPDGPTPAVPDDDPHSFVETPPATGSIAADVINPAESLLFNQTTREAKQEEKEFIKFSIVPPLNEGLKNPLIFADYMAQNKRFTNTYKNPTVPPTKYVDIPRNTQPVFTDVRFDVFDRRRKTLNQRQDGGYNECKFAPVVPMDPMEQDYKYSTYFPDDALANSTRQPYYGDTLNFSRNDGADRFAPRSDPFYQGGYANQRNIEETMYKSQKYSFAVDPFYSVRGQSRRRR